MVNASDLMQSEVVSVGPDDRLSSVCRLLYEEEITGAPVLDEQGQVVGFVSMRDLIRTLQEDHEALLGMPNYYGDAHYGSQPDWMADPDEFEERLAHRLVSEIMTRDIVSVAPDDPISAVAQKVIEQRIHRVLVVDDQLKEGNLLGIISLFDLVSLLTRKGGFAARAS